MTTIRLFLARFQEFRRSVHEVVYSPREYLIIVCQRSIVHASGRNLNHPNRARREVWVQARPLDTASLSEAKLALTPSPKHVHIKALARRLSDNTSAFDALALSVSRFCLGLHFQGFAAYLSEEWVGSALALTFLED